MKDSTKQENVVKILLKATVNATKEQLVEIGCDRDLMKLEVDVTDVDKWCGMYAPCSTVYFTYVLSENYSFNEEYIIPTRWLIFK